jgi:hypothetical protein
LPLPRRRLRSEDSTAESGDAGSREYRCGKRPLPGPRWHEILPAARSRKRCSVTRTVNQRKRDNSGLWRLIPGGNRHREEDHGQPTASRHGRRPVGPGLPGPAPHCVAARVSAGDAAGGGPLPIRPAQPFAVSVDFSNTAGGAVTWALSRELLTAGPLRPSGEGDVRIWPPCRRHGGTNLHVLLLGRTGAALLEVAIPPCTRLARRHLRDRPQTAGCRCRSW